MAKRVWNEKLECYPVLEEEWLIGRAIRVEARYISYPSSNSFEAREGIKGKTQKWLESKGSILQERVWGN